MLCSGKSSISSVVARGEEGNGVIRQYGAFQGSECKACCITMDDIYQHVRTSNCSKHV